MAEHENHAEEHAKASHGPHGGHGGGGHEEHEGAPEWLISFADNVALMMGFFVILLAMNMQAPKAKSGIGSEEGNPPSDEMLEAVVAIRQAFNNPVDMDSGDPTDTILRDYLRSKGKGESKQTGDQGQSKEHQADRATPYSNLGATIPFDDGSAELTARAQQRAEDMAARVRTSRYVIEVQGHCSPGEVGRDHRRADALSYQRALAVKNVLIRQGVAPSRINLKVSGTNERVVPRSYDPDVDGANQRVEIVVTEEIAASALDVPAPAPPADPAPAPAEEPAPADDQGDSPVHK